MPQNELYPSAIPTPPSTRLFAPEARCVWSSVEWAPRDCMIGGSGFSQPNVQAPVDWSDTAVNVAASRYFHGDGPNREASIRSLIERVTTTIATWAVEDGATDDETAFADDLSWLVLHQHAAFNSPVWFNVGVRPDPQCSACFINSVEDDLGSILELASTEGRLFKWGSGSGVNLSVLRSSAESLSGGGTASGPIAFMRGLDAMAGAIKSGGKTRRAAKMVLLDVDHPDVVEFMTCKATEEKKAWALIDAGYDGSFAADDGAYASVAFQNANHSVRLSDAFLTAVEDDRAWPLLDKQGQFVEAPPARSLLRTLAEACHLCGDPGVQFSDTINRWHTCAADGPINASNPCSEFVFLDDSACNLASVNLLRFVDDTGELQVNRLVSAVERLITAMDVLVDRAGYPTERLAENARKYRPLGLGYANLGALVMARGLPYDSDAGRELAAGITAILTGAAYRASARLAAKRGPFAAYEQNRETMACVISQHAAAADRLTGRLAEVAQSIWTEVLAAPSFRNAQVSVLAPTGTIGFFMDCDTTGVEPEISLVHTRRLSDGGLLESVNGSVPRALTALGYTPIERAAIEAYLTTHRTIEGAPGLREIDLPVFDCALRSAAGTRSIAARGHLRMMAAVQPFLSGAISKTVNLPHETTVEEIEELVVESWRMGLKAVAFYRDGSKRTQPVGGVEHKKKTGEKPRRRRLPDERQAITHKFVIADHEGYLTVGLYEDGTPGEIFMTMAKQGSVIGGLVDAFATSVSMALQYGVPLDVLVKKFQHTRFEPSGFTNNPRIRIAKSITDYVFRWLALRFLEAPPMELEEDRVYEAASDAPPCSNCGDIMVRSGACYKCTTCGGSSGCS
ncbi:MAG: vitamin B12-dependent ribonucleotide reductase [Proteobacteria bacterium]|nr:vitamin B12-dependent ribonucleotide reductase [Pseudomonadota bacterium]